MSNIMKDGENVPLTSPELQDYINEGKFAFQGRLRESHAIAVAISGDDILSQPYNTQPNGDAAWIIKKYTYQLFSKLSPDMLVDFKKLLIDSDTIIWRSCLIEDGLYRIRLAAIKNGEQLFLSMSTDEAGVEA